MESMKKLMETGSHFELINGKRLPDVNIVQIFPIKVYMNKSTGFAVFLCEVMDDERK